MVVIALVVVVSIFVAFVIIVVSFLFVFSGDVADRRM